MILDLVFREKLIKQSEQKRITSLNPGEASSSDTCKQHPQPCFQKFCQVTQPLYLPNGLSPQS